MNWQVQISTWTANNRYPGIFRTVRARVAQRKGSDLFQGRLKILSFGCSNGAELSSLRAYFPDAQLYGCDVNAEVLRTAAEGLLMDEVLLFVSSPEALVAHGPFDIVFAMSVLCRFPESAAARLDDLRTVYNPEDFALTVDALVGSLRPDGILALYNTNYPFAALPASRRFRAVTSALIQSNGFVDKFDLSGRRLTRHEHRGPYSVHTLDPARPDQPIDFMRCVFELANEGSGAVAELSDVTVAVGGETSKDPAEPPHGHRFGPDLEQCAREGVVAVALGFWRESDRDGARIVRAWRRTTEDGRIEQGTAWATDVDRAVLAPLTTDPTLFKIAAPPAPAWTARSIARLLRERVSGR